MKNKRNKDSPEYVWLIFRKYCNKTMFGARSENIPETSGKLVLSALKPEI